MNRSRRWRGGWLRLARRKDSPHYNVRPRCSPVALVVLHSISLPAGVYGGPWITDLFLGRLDTSAHESFAALRGLRVSAHFVIRRDGEVLQYVDADRRAWHAGASRWRGRSNCNDFSIGVELEGLEGQHFERAQYTSLVRLLHALVRRYPIREVVGHEHVAPGRKFDPGPGFDWAGLRQRLRLPALRLFGQPIRGPQPGSTGHSRRRRGHQ